MNAASYPPPVDRLLTFGECEVSNAQWPDYPQQLGLQAEHIPDLIRMATDEGLNWADSESLEVWAPVHAWRALGQLRAEAAIEPLMNLFHELEESDWAREELPQVYGLIGAAALPVLQAYLADKSHGLFPRITAASCIEEIGKQHPQARDECVAILTQQLEKFVKNHPDLNGFLISNLTDLNAIESAPVMERAFAAKRVDPLVIGNWHDVQISLGLLTEVEWRQQQWQISQNPVVNFQSATSNTEKEIKGFGSTSSKQSHTKKKKSNKSH